MKSRFTQTQRRQKTRTAWHTTICFAIYMEIERDFDLALLSRLFPRVAKYHRSDFIRFQGTISESQADEQKRVCHPDYFMIYFSLHVEEGYMGAQELEAVIEAANRERARSEAESYFGDYLQNLSGLKRYRFLEKMVRFLAGLNLIRPRH